MEEHKQNVSYEVPKNSHKPEPTRTESTKKLKGALFPPCIPR